MPTAFLEDPSSVPRSLSLGGSRTLVTHTHRHIQIHTHVHACTPINLFLKKKNNPFCYTCPAFISVVANSDFGQTLKLSDITTRRGQLFPLPESSASSLLILLCPHCSQAWMTTFRLVALSGRPRPQPACSALQRFLLT